MTLELNVNTDQEAFDKVVRHLAQTNGRSIGAHGQCKYRGQYGRKCAVGALIDDDDMANTIDGFGSIRTVVAEVGYRGDVSVPLMARMQSIHDAPGSWKDHGFDDEGWERMRRAGSEFNLDTREIEAVTS